MKIVQIGANKAGDELSEHLHSNYEELQFGLFVEANSLHIEDIKNCYRNYSNVIVENIAVKPKSKSEDTLTIYYHTNEHPHYGMASCHIEHIQKHMTWCPHLQGGEIKSFDVPCITIEELFEKYSIYELDWLYLDIEGIDAEILLTTDWKKYKIKRFEFESLHLEKYADAIKNMMIGMGYTQVNSLHPYDWAFENKNFISLEDKLKNFPPINFISITESEQRRELLYKKFNQYELENITPHVFERYDDSKHTFFGDSGKRLLGAGRGPTTSHLKAIKNWYFNTDEEYAFFCEDDLSLETVEYWNFTWDEFFNNLPSDWGCVQLCWVRENVFSFSNDGVSLRPRCWCDWSACAYLIKRSHAKKIISNYYRDGDFNLEYVGDDASLRPDWALRPTAETVIFSNLSPIYSFPLFVEDTNNCLSTFGNGVGVYNSSSYSDVINWWKNTGKNTPLSQIIRYNSSNIKK
jgi:FkbM family methyltransferase